MVQNIDLMDRATPYTINSALLIYIDASNLQRRKEVVIVRDPQIQQELKHRAEWIMSTPVAEIPPEGITMDKECSYCPYTDECNALIRDNKAMKDAERVNNVFK